jgi:FkbM family methyltransferase
MRKGLAQIVFRQFLNNYPSTGIRKIYTSACFYLRNAIVKYMKDPVIDFDLSGVRMKMNLSYNLPILLKDRPYYNAALPRLSGFLRQHTGHLTFIDVGANIGDTAALISRVVPDGKYLCIEASDFYFNALKLNVSQVAGITAVQALCDEGQGLASVSMDVIGDSAVVKSAAGGGIRTVTIDQLVAEYAQFKHANVLKIDTDGYDFRILRGSENMLVSARPVLFFEFSPYHLKDAGEDPLSIFPFLQERGYRKMLLYDKFGYLFIEAESSETSLLERITGYTLRRRGEYFDILVFHDTMTPLFGEFAALEKKVFAKQ